MRPTRLYRRWPVLNDKVYVEASAALSRRMTTEVKGGPAERGTYGFRLCTARTPTTVVTLPYW